MPTTNIMKRQKSKPKYLKPAWGTCILVDLMLNRINQEKLKPNPPTTLILDSNTYRNFYFYLKNKYNLYLDEQIEEYFGIKIKVDPLIKPPFIYFT